MPTNQYLVRAVIGRVLIRVQHKVVGHGEQDREQEGRHRQAQAAVRCSM